MNNIHSVLDSLEVNNIIMGGDFNTQLDSSTTTRDVYPKALEALLEEYSLVDVWRRKNPSSKRGTFHRGSYSSRLDYIFAQECFLPSISSIAISPESLSDHCRVIMEVDAPKITRGPGFWRFDNTLLSDTTFVQEIRTTIEEALEVDPNLAWEWTKHKIREHCISYTIKRNRESRALISTLTKRLESLAQDHDLSDSPEVVQEVASIKRELAEIQQHKANKAIFRAKVQWTLLGLQRLTACSGLSQSL